MTSPFRVPDVKRALKVALDSGLTVTGYQIGPDGSILVWTAAQERDEAEAALEAWKRKHG